MMKPFMNQNVVIFQETGETDKYGKPMTTEKHTKARVQYKAQFIQDSKGEKIQTNIEVDVPADVNPDEGVKIKGETPDGNTFEGTIKSKEDIVNLFGNKVFYKTVFINGTK